MSLIATHPTLVLTESSDGAEVIIDDARPRDKAEQSKSSSSMLAGDVSLRASDTDALTSKVTSLQQELTKMEQANAGLEQRLKAQKQASMTMMTMSKQGYDAKLSHSSWVLQQCFEKLQVCLFGTHSAFVDNFFVAR